MPDTTFFGGLLRGFGGSLLDSTQQAQQMQQRQQATGTKELLDFYLKGIEENRLNPELGWPLVAGILAEPLQGMGGGKGKGKGGSAAALAALADPENLSQFLSGAHQAFAGPAGVPLPGVGPAPMGRTNAPEMRPQSVPPEENAGVQPGDEQEAIPAPLEGRSTMVEPRSRLYNTPAQQQRLQREKQTGEQAATTEGALQGRIRVAEQLLERDVQTFRQTNHREPKPEEQAGMKTKAYAMVDMDVTGARIGAPVSYQEGERVPDSKSATGYSRQWVNPRDPNDIKFLPAEPPGWSPGEYMPDPTSPTGWVRQWRSTVDPKVMFPVPSADPISRSTRGANPAERKAHELFGTPDEDPRATLLRLTPEQEARVTAALREDAAKQAGATTEARQKELEEARRGRFVSVDDAIKLQVDFGTTVKEVAELRRKPLTPPQIQASGALGALERDLDEAEPLFEKVWPRIAQPEARRVALGTLQRNQNRDFVRLQAALSRMPIRMAVMEQGSRPSDTDMLIFKEGMPNTQSGNWDVVETPSSYESGKDLLAAARRMIEGARRDIGILKPEERAIANQPVRAAPGATPGTGAQGTVPGVTRDANGNWVVTPR